MAVAPTRQRLAPDVFRLPVDRIREGYYSDAYFNHTKMLLEEQGHRRDYVEAYRAWGKFLRRSGREDEALEVLERAADLAAEPVAADHRGTR